MTGFTVSKLARLVGTSADALRYYERIGLLPEPTRSASGYRLYEEDAVERVRFIKASQRFGLRLDEIRELVRIRDRGLCPCGHTRELLGRRMAEIDKKMEELAGLRAGIARMLDEMPVRGVPGWRCGSEPIQIGARPPHTPN